MVNDVKDNLIDKQTWIKNEIKVKTDYVRNVVEENNNERITYHQFLDEQRYLDLLKFELDVITVKLMR